MGVSAAVNAQEAIAIGRGALASGTGSLVVGAGSSTGDRYGTALGFENSVTQRQATAVGYKNTISEAFSTTVGNENLVNSANATVVGVQNVADAPTAGATNPNSIALFGRQNQGTANNTTAIGRGNIASASTATALGYENTASGIDSIAIGRRTSSTGRSSVTLGNNSVAGGENAISIGRQNSAAELNSISMGYQAQSLGQFGIAIGNAASTSAEWNSIAIGQSASAQGTRSLALGLQAGLNSLTTNDNQISMGAQAGQNVNGSNNTAIGYQTGQTVVGLNNLLLGTRAGQNLSGSRNTVMGWTAGQNINGGDNLLLGSYAGGSTRGQFNNALGYYAGFGSIGSYNIASGHTAGAYVTGSNNVAIGNRAGTNALVTQDLSTGQPTVLVNTPLNITGTVALGNLAVATKNYGLAIGSNTIASGEGSSAIGAGSSATADRSLALGALATASTADSVALGNRAQTAAATGTSSANILGTTYTFAGTTPLGTVSIGSAGEERTLTNLAAGRINNTSTDAVNGSQLYATNQALATVSSQAGAGWQLQANGANGSIVSSTSTAGNTLNLTNTDANITIGKTATDNALTFNLANTISIADGLSVGSQFNVNNTGAYYSGPITSNTHITNKEYVDQAVASVGGGNGTPTTINFAANAGGNIARTNNNTLTIAGGQTTAGNYVSSNTRTVADPTTGEIQVQFASAPQFGTIIVNDGESGRITGVTAAVLSTTSDHAVNGSQLVALGSSMAAALSPGSTYNPATNAINAQISIGNSVYNNVQDAIQAVANNSGGSTTPQAPSSWFLGTSATGSGVATGSLNSQVNDQEVVTLTAGDNIITRQNGSAVSIEVNRNLTNLESVSIAGGPTMDRDGINMAGGRITNMADGIGDMDAVNVRQLNSGLADTLNRANNYTDNAISRLGGNLEDYRRDASAGTAAAMAMAQLPQSSQPGMVSMGVSTWDNEQAIAMGYSRATTDGRFIVRASGTMNTRSKAGASVGFGYQF